MQMVLQVSGYLWYDTQGAQGTLQTNVCPSNPSDGDLWYDTEWDYLSALVSQGG